MTLDEVKVSSKEELQTKAAALIGWNYVGVMPYTGKVFGYPPKYQAKSPEAEERPEMWPPRLGAQEVPDYPSDPTVAWELENALPNIARIIKYVAVLQKLVETDFSEGIEMFSLFRLIHASPIDRTRAFILAMSPE